MRTREELAWAAGFFDGEGCTSATRHSVVLSISQLLSNVDCLIRFRDAIGFGKLHGPYYHRRTRGGLHAPNMRLHITNFEQVQATMAMMWLWLGPAKKRQYIHKLRDTRTLERRRGGNQAIYRRALEARSCGAVLVLWSPRHLLAPPRGASRYRRTTRLVPARRLTIAG